MKGLLAIVFSVLVAAGTARAGDFAAPPYRAPIAAVPIVVPVYDWTGFYVGANLGYSWGPWTTSSNQPIFNFESLTAAPHVNGWLGGFQAGYNMQLASPFVVGLEADGQLTGEKDSQNWTDPGVPLPPMPVPCPVTPIGGTPPNGCPCPTGTQPVGNPPVCEGITQAFVPQRPGAGPAVLSSEWKLPWFATFRGRIGVTPDAERLWLLYVTGGPAVGESDYNFTWSNPGGAPGRQSYALSSHQTRLGYALGGGVERVVWNAWTVKLEYIYLDLGTASINTTDIDGAPFHVGYWARDHILRVGLNYRFGVSPAVAKY